MNIWEAVETSNNLIEEDDCVTIISLDGILTMVASIDELPMAWESLIYLLLDLGFLINIKKEVLDTI